MTTIKIPTAEELSGRLAGLERLIVARNWERAAIVSAFTRNDGVGRPEKMLTSEQFPVTVAEFAKLGFKGLGSRNTVELYRQRWTEAIVSGHACSVVPGDEVELPDLPWPPNPNPSLRTEGTAYEDSEDRAAEIQRLAEDPELAGRARGAIRAATSSPETLQVVAQTATDEQAQAMIRGLNRRPQSRPESEDAELKIIANGGRIPSLDEVNQRFASPGLDSLHDKIQKEFVQKEKSTEFDKLITVIDTAIDALKDMGPFTDDSPEAIIVRQCSLALLDTISQKVRP